MAGNTLGTFLKLTTFGESHGPAMGGILDGMPPRIPIDMGFLKLQLQRRATGNQDFSSQRKEADELEILSGLMEGETLGSPIAFMVRNKDQRSGDYTHLREVFRSGHADITYFLKYGIRDHRGGGRASARETISWVIGGSLVASWLHSLGIQILGYVSVIGGVKLEHEPEELTRSRVLGSPVSCPDPDVSNQMEDLLREVGREGDTLGGVITVVIDGLPAGLGEPVFDKFHADLAKACMSLNAVKAFEIGEGIASASQRGSRFKDEFNGFSEDGTPLFLSNRAGGVLGGITTGQQVRFSVAFKPISSTKMPAHVMKQDGAISQIHIGGRHDTCPVPRAVPILESLAALVCGDHLLRSKAYTAR